MKKILSILLAIIVIPMTILSCSNKTEDNGKLKIAVSTYVLGEFTEKIGGDKVDIYTVVKENMEPHDFEFTVNDKKEINQREVFIYNGLGLEDWLEQAKDGSNAVLVNASRDADVIITDGAEDPHIWLSLKEAIKECNVIKEALIEKDPNNKDYYEENYSKYKEEIEKVYDEYVGKLEVIKGKTFVTSHEAFAYLCRDFGLNQKAIKGVLNDDVESTFKDMQGLADYCKAENIKVIFSESSESQKDAETLAKAVNANVVPIYTLETKVEDKSYLDVMKDNYNEMYEYLK